MFFNFGTKHCHFSKLCTFSNLTITGFMFKLNGTSRKLVEFCTKLQHLNFNTKLEMILAIHTYNNPGYCLVPCGQWWFQRWQFYDNNYSKWLYQMYFTFPRLFFEELVTLPLRTQDTIISKFL